MPVTYNFRKGLDLPSWHWLNQYTPGSSQPGTAMEYDGARYLYFAVQRGSATSASTTELFRFDTWSNGWQFLAALTSGFAGIDIEYDPIRNILLLTEGNNTTPWRYFNLNLTAVTFLGLTTNAMTLSAAITTVLPTGASTGASLSLPRDVDALFWTDSGAAATGTTTTTIVASTAQFQGGLVGAQVRFTSGTQSGNKSIVASVTNPTTLVLGEALAGAPAAGDTFVIEVPQGRQASGGSVTTLVDAGSGFPTNWYANSDVEITSGTGVGQRRRIASNDGTTLTLAASVTGNPRTGNWGTAPDATSVYRIVPSTDFLYYTPANNGTSFNKIDMVATTLAWTALAVWPSAPGGGCNTMVGRSCGFFSLFGVRGQGSNGVYRYDIGLNSWTNINAVMGVETFSTGAHSSLMVPKRRIFIQKESNNRCVALNLATAELEPFTLSPYAAPSGNDGKRAKYVLSPDGVDWLYLFRAGGQELFRIPVEWVP